MISRAVAIGAAFVFAGTSVAAAAPPPNDADFIQKAIKGDNSEVMLGGIAAQRGASPAMKRFGATLVSDHSKGREQATKVALAMHVTPPRGPMAEADVERAKLMLLSGAAFDREFANYMVHDHQNDIADFRGEAAQGHGQAAALARTTLPVLRKHLAMAEALTGKGR